MRFYPLFVLIALSLLTTATPAGAADGPAENVEVHGTFITAFLFQTDSDFDSTARHYDRDGQTVGQAATFFRPDLTLRPLDHLTLFYQVELGWNAWSRNNVDQWFPAADDAFLVKHRELWARWDFDGGVGLGAGYQHVADPSRLFLDHWSGFLSVDITSSGSRTRILAGQLPDSTFEGIEVRDNNFVHDAFLVGALGEFDVTEDLVLDAALLGLGDYRVPERPLYLATALAGVRYQTRSLRVWGHLLGQSGVWKSSGVNGGDQAVLSWAAQAGMEHRIAGAHWGVNLLALSPDDDHDGNNRIGAFFGSAKNYSASLWLTEDELRDRYDNLDERIATTWGPFSLNRAGLMVFDANVGFHITDWFHPVLIAAAAWNLNRRNAEDHVFVGFETDLLLEFPLGTGTSLLAMGQFLLPGTGASVFVNEIDREATQPLFGAQAGFFTRF
ncbi:MAG: hypothetical protein ABIK09_05705 [Pseudomonadota bacterium]